MAENTICVEWVRGPLTGRLYHQPLPFSRIGNVTYIGCDRCGEELYAYDEEGNDVRF